MEFLGRVTILFAYESESGIGFGSMFRGSAAEKHLLSVCRKLGARPASEFHGFHLKGAGYLYRRGRVVAVHGTHYRWEWKNPFGSEQEHRAYDFVLLDGPESPNSNRRFFVLTKREIAYLLNLNPRAAEIINIPCAPVRDIGGWRGYIMGKAVETVR